MMLISDITRLGTGAVHQRGKSFLRSVKCVNWSNSGKLIPPLEMPGLLVFVVVIVFVLLKAEAIQEKRFRIVTRVLLCKKIKQLWCIEFYLE